jgi:hypothetical protein
VIVDVEASRAIRQAEVGAAKTMIDRNTMEEYHRAEVAFQKGDPCARPLPT